MSVPIFWSIRIFISVFAAVSAATLVVAYVLRDHADEVTSTVWIRGSLVLLSSLALLWFASRAAAGHERSFVRLRLISVVVLVALVVMAALPGVLPTWMRVEHVIGAALMLAVVIRVAEVQRRGGVVAKRPASAPRTQGT
ncbi:hypothetical protein [Luteipulveratus mongoliensis]|uniref:Uncharacterized protein n=1 Tax=Luteipulveratus mongoliensis TaxID=571913 RepID=A0A0K1JGM0_9MICO|nr:hypothetical protein [Luteipulveratus mongoliensis]AKU15856.1 hypothetical protein VV02_08315 [Luteipulveratus mongoliensis]